jgi:nucleotide-binding universal stress UspA family protein
VIRKILIAIDESAAAACAARVGVELADQLRATVLLLNVVDPASTIDPQYGINRYELDHKLAAARQMLRTLRATLLRWVPIEELVAQRPVIEGILTIASEWRADLIVLGNADRGRLLHLIVGGVADGVLRRATSPVMSVSVHACKTMPADLAMKCDA